MEVYIELEANADCVIISACIQAILSIINVENRQ